MAAAAENFSGTAGVGKTTEVFEIIHFAVLDASVLCCAHTGMSRR